MATRLSNIQQVEVVNNLSLTGTVTTAGTTTVDNAAGAAAVNVQDGGNSLTVDGTVAVSSVGGTVAVSAAALPLPSGAATSANQTTQITAQATQVALETSINSTIASIDTKTPTVGQKAMAASTPVVIASNQSDLQVELSFLQHQDAFSRIRTSFPRTLFDCKMLVDNMPLVFDDAQVSGSGTSSTYNTNQASVTLAVSASTAGKRVRQSFARMPYQPGHSQLGLFTGILGTPASGITRRIGLFDDKNGVFFESGPSNVSVVIRSYTGGSASDTAFTQANWNLDKLNGSGASGITLDFSKTQIMVVMYQWLGVGSAWFGFDVSGQLIWAHRVDNTNSISTVYMSTPNLPVRYSITNDGTGGAASMLQICSSVMSEGGEANIGIDNTVVRDTALSLTSGAAYVPLIALQLQTGYEGARVDIEIINSVALTTSAIYSWKLILNPTVSGTALSFTPKTNSAIQYDISRTNATTVTGGTEVASGFGSTTQSYTERIAAPGDIRLGSKIDGTNDILVLAVNRIAGATPDICGSIIWKEYL